jgi:hypothetical protein
MISVRRLFFLLVTFVIPLLILWTIFEYQPFFSHMDDGARIEKVSELSLLDSLYYLMFMHGSMYGYFGSTAFSMLLRAPLYYVGDLFGAAAFYSLNAVHSSLIIIAFLTASAYVGMFSIRLLPTAVAATFLWPFTLEMFFFRGGEDGAILAIAFLLWWLRRSISIKSQYVFLGTSISLFALVALVKSTVIVFLPAIAMIAWMMRAEYPDGFRPGLLIFLAFLMMVVIALATMTGAYSSGVRYGTVVSNISRPYPLLLTGITLAYAMYLGIRIQRGRSKPLEAAPLAMMVIMTAAIIFIGERNYFLAPFGPMFGVAVAVGTGHLSHLTLQRAASGAILAASLAWVLFRTPQVFLPLHGIGAFTQGDFALRLAQEHAVVYTSCAEGAGHFRRYSEWKWGISPDFRPLEGEGGYRFGIPEDAVYVFGDRRLCPAPSGLTGWDIAWSSRGKDGFRLYRKPSQID